MRALVVDDAPIMRHFLSMCLSSFRRMEVDQAVNGNDALKKLNDSTYDVVLLDVNLPGIDGCNVLAQLRQMPEPRGSTPVIVVTTSPSPAILKKIQELGAGFLSKPVSVSAVRDSLCTVFRVTQALPPGVAERRRAPRLNIPIQIEFSAGLKGMGQAHDINAFGAFFATDDLPAVGTKGVISLRFPHVEKGLEVDCRVMRVRREALDAASPKGFAVRFEPVTEDLANALVQAFISPQTTRAKT